MDAAEIRIKRMQEFKYQLGMLMFMYGIGIVDHDKFDGQDDYLETVKYFSIDGERWHSETVEEVIEQCQITFG